MRPVGLSEPVASLVFIDGQFMAPDDAKISVFDHGFLFGDSVYEVLRTYEGILFTVGEHLDRLRRSAEAIHLPLPWNRAEIVSVLEEATRRSGNVESYVRVIVTRGAGEPNIDPVSCVRPSLVVIVKPLSVPAPELYARGVEVKVVGVQRVSRRAVDPNIKSGNYLNSVLAIIETRAAGAVEGIMLGDDGRLTEGTTSNVFLVAGGRLLTPNLGSGILQGITRSIVLELVAATGMACEESHLTRKDLEVADEAFLTSTIREVLPVRQVDERVLRRAPGPVTRRVMDLYRRWVADHIAARRREEIPK